MTIVSRVWDYLYTIVEGLLFFCRALFFLFFYFQCSNVWVCWVVTSSKGLWPNLTNVLIWLVFPVKLTGVKKVMIWHDFQPHIPLLGCRSQLHQFVYNLQVAQLWQRDRASSEILRGWVNLTLNFRWKGYVSHQYPWTARWGNGYTTTLPLEAFTRRHFVADFIQSKLSFMQKKWKKHFLSHPLVDLWVMYALHL